MIKWKRILPFGLAGIVGFLVDAGVLTALVDMTGPFVGRAISFSLAVLTTWLINRNFAFADCAAPKPGMGREFCRYFAAMIPGSLVNWLAFLAVITFMRATPWTPILAVAAGSIAGMATNLGMAERFAFTTKR